MGEAIDYELINELPESLKDFKQISSNLSSMILQMDDSIDPICYRIFNQLFDECENDFSFFSGHLNYEEMHEFFDVVIEKYKNYQPIVVDSTPDTAYFIGDTHGAIEESYKLIRFFLSKLKAKENIKIIFLGDYVDRNPYDFENLSLILTFAIIFPENVKLIRGNHEDQIINQYYGFLDNLLRVYHNLGENLHHKILEFFKLLPIVNITEFKQDETVKARVMAVHGGIPVNFQDFMTPVILENLTGLLNSQVSNSEEMDEYTQCMLWSDPDENIQGILTGAHLQGRMRFGFPIFERFLAANNIHMVVRGHQKWKEGCRIFFGGRLYSLFSTASYDGRKQFDPKFLRLTIGKTPEIMEISDDMK